MTENDEVFPPNQKAQFDDWIEQMLHTRSFQSDDQHDLPNAQLLQELQAVSQEQAQTVQRRVDRVWQRVEIHVRSSPDDRLQGKRPVRLAFTQERVFPMQATIQNGRLPVAPTPERRHALRRLVSLISAVAAVLVMTVVIIGLFASHAPGTSNPSLERPVAIPTGERIWQIAGQFADQSVLHKLASGDFVQIAQTGTYTDAHGKRAVLTSEYWFLNHDQQDGTAPTFALEGYLFPGSYQIDAHTTAADVIHEMLNAFGEQLCPGPNGQPDSYLNNEQQCEAHPALDPATGQSIFDLLKKNYSDADGTSMADKLYHALTLASIVEREVGPTHAHEDRQGITSVYYNRYLVSKNEVQTDEVGVDHLQADPTLQYALGTPDTPWPQLQQGGSSYNLGAYDTYLYPGLPPGPISNPGADALTQSINPESTTYLYFIIGKDGLAHYANTYAEQQQNIVKYGVG